MSIVRDYEMANEVLEEYRKELFAKIKRLETAQTKWINVNDKLPETGLRVLVCDGHKTVKAGCRFGKDKIGKQWKWYIEGTYQNDITHWAYMPEPPKEVRNA